MREYQAPVPREPACCRWMLAALVAIAAALPSHALTRVAFLPFKDLVRLKESWDLAVDVPRYFSVTVDTIGSKDSSLAVVPFDTVQKIIKDNAWNRDTYTSRRGLQRLASVLSVDYLVTGTVSQFKVMKLAINSEAPVDASNQFGNNTYGSGGVTIMGGLQSYNADVTINVDVYSGRTGSLQEHLPMSTKEKDAGFKMYLPVQRDNPEMTFYHMSRSPFGSEYFQKSVPGAVMKYFSLTIKRKFQGYQSHSAKADTVAKEFLSGVVLERSGVDVYVDLGSADKLLQGEVLEVMKPSHALVSGSGDTLGWADKAVGLVKIRFVKAEHFSVGTVVEERDTIDTRCTVRTRAAPGNGQ